MRKNQKVKNWYNFEPSDIRGEDCSLEPTKTIPNQTMSLKDLISRFVRGQDVVTLEPVYGIDEEGNEVLQLPEIDKMDQMERLEYLENVKDLIKEEQEELSATQDRIHEAQLAIKEVKNAPPPEEPKPEESNTEKKSPKKE